MSKDDALEKWETDILTSVKYIFGILTNIYYIMIFIIYIKQRCTLSIKKGIILLLTLTLFTLNILYLFVFYDLIEQRSLETFEGAPTNCIIITAIKNYLLLINNYQFSFIFFYTYLGLYYPEFLVRNKKKICFIYLGLTSAVGIILCTPPCFDKSMIVLNTGECELSLNLLSYIYLIFISISVLILIFSLVKIYLNLRRNEEHDDESKVYTKKLFILGIIIVLTYFIGSIIVPLSFTVSKNTIIITIRTFIQIVSPFVFIVFYSYDKEFGKTMKEIFLCKKNSTPPIGDTIFEELCSK